MIQLFSPYALSAEISFLILVKRLFNQIGTPYQLQMTILHYIFIREKKSIRKSVCGHFQYICSFQYWQMVHLKILVVTIWIADIHALIQAASCPYCLCRQTPIHYNLYIYRDLDGFIRANLYSSMVRVVLYLMGICIIYSKLEHPRGITISVNYVSIRNMF